MVIDSLKVRGQRCFKTNWAGFETLKPVNVIIGRNNSGKSQLLDLVAQLCGKELSGSSEYTCLGVLDEATLKRVFRAAAQRDSGFSTSIKVEMG